MKSAHFSKLTRVAAAVALVLSWLLVSAPTVVAGQALATGFEANSGPEGTEAATTEKTAVFTLTQPGPSFQLGFKALTKAMSSVVGYAVESERYTESGDSYQRTSNGLMVWTRVTNLASFTDGEMTWVSGPSGIEKRHNDEQFPWEER